MKKLLLLFLLACSKEPEPIVNNHVEFIAAAPGDVATQIKDERAKMQKRNRTLVVYVGATWCEPCQRFHRAAQAGKLDKDFPRLSLLEFDLDADGERLQKAGYHPAYIPFFGMPGDDGRATERSFEGSIKGEGAVDDIKPKLQELIGK